MYDFPILISLLITIIVGYFSILFPLQKAIEDLTITTKSNQKENVNSEISLKLKKYKKLKKILTLIFIVLVSIVILLYSWPIIQNINIVSLLQKTVPFKEGFFSDRNFTFSYITGLICSVVVEFIYFNAFIFNIFEHNRYKYIITIITLIILAFGLIWFNYLFSDILSCSIIHYFELLSIGLNLFVHFLLVINLVIICIIFNI